MTSFCSCYDNNILIDDYQEFLNQFKNAETDEDVLDTLLNLTVMDKIRWKPYKYYDDYIGSIRFYYEFNYILRDITIIATKREIMVIKEYRMCREDEPIQSDKTELIINLDKYASDGLCSAILENIKRTHEKDSFKKRRREEIKRIFE